VCFNITGFCVFVCLKTDNQRVDRIDESLNISLHLVIRLGQRLLYADSAVR